VTFIILHRILNLLVLGEHAAEYVLPPLQVPVQSLEILDLAARLKNDTVPSDGSLLYSRLNITELEWGTYFGFCYFY
jgi:hypothetical protein